MIAASHPTARPSPVVATLSLPAGAAVVAVSARLSVDVPGSPVPQSLQTLAVVLVGAVLGPERGAAALLVYLVLGAVGLPVFADGAAGWEHLFGSTAGYLWSFPPAAALVGWWAAQERPGTEGRADGSPAGTWLRAACAMVAAHGVVLGAGWAWLAGELGPGAAFTGGVAPFVWGGIVKSAFGAALVTGWWRWLARRV